jgi:anti-anti-sigma regulatory factor
MSSPYIKIENETAIIKLNDLLTIDYANEIHRLFAEVFEKNIPVLLDFSLAKSCDCTFLQLIVSLCFSLSNKGLRLDIQTETVPQVILDTVRSLGFNCKNNCTRLKNTQCLMSKLNNLGAQGKESGTV